MSRGTRESLVGAKGKEESLSRIQTVCTFISSPLIYIFISYMFPFFFLANNNIGDYKIKNKKYKITGVSIA